MVTWFHSKQWKRLKVGHWLDIKRKNKIEDTKEKEKRQTDRNKNTHLSPHNRHLSLKHGFVEAFICLKRKKNNLLAGVPCHMLLCCQTALCLFFLIRLNRERQERRGKFSGGLYLEHLIEVLTEVLDKVHVREAGQHQISGLLGEGHLSLGEPCPVERV